MVDLQHSLSVPRAAYIALAGLGILAWWVTTSLSGVREAWDADYYFSIAYPLFALTAICAGWTWGRGWRHGLLIMAAQALPLLLTVPSALRPFPDGLILLVLLSLPLMLLGSLASRLGRAHRHERR